MATKPAAMPEPEPETPTPEVVPETPAPVQGAPYSGSPFKPEWRSALDDPAHPLHHLRNAL